MHTYRLVMAAILLLAMLFGLVPAALAAPPEFFSEYVEASLPIEGCDFPVRLDYSSTLKASVHFDRNGDFKMFLERVQDQLITYTNLETGFSISSTMAGGVNRVIVDQDGTVTLVIMGLLDIVTLPGQGLVVQDVGRLIYDLETDQLLFSAGKFTAQGPGGSVEALCAALE